MELPQIEATLHSLDPSQRMQAIAALRHHAPGVAVPLLIRCICDKEFLVRSCAVSGLGVKISQASFDALVDLIEYETDANVRAEAANSLANYGEVAWPYLLNLFRRDDHWLVRQSILAAMAETGSPEYLLLLCQYGIEDGDDYIQTAAIACLSLLANTPYEASALELLLPLVSSSSSQVRAQVARTLGHFDQPAAIEALMELKRDSDHRVVGATLEKCLLL
jgi:HEAT repeat protein